MSKSLTPGFVSATMAGPWNDFVVSKALAVNQFIGAIRFTTGGGGNWTKNYINFMDLPVWDSDHSKYDARIARHARRPAALQRAMSALVAQTADAVPSPAGN